MSVHSSKDILILAESVELAEFAKLLHGLTGLQMALFGSDGATIKIFAAAEGESPLCRLIRATPDGEHRCYDCDRAHSERAARRRRGMCYVCHAGLTDFAVPIHAGGRHVGTISCGQLLPDPPSEAGLQQFLLHNRDLKLDRAAAGAAYFRCHYLPPDKLATVLELFAFFARHLCRVTLRLRQVERRGEQPEIARAKRYIASHLRGESLCLGDVAREVGLSPAYLSDLFHRATGTRFTRFVQTLRVRESRSLLRKTAMPITQIAYDCGFQSLTHFNRVFRNLVGSSPSQFRGS